MEIKLTQEEDPYLEFRKAYNKLNFDYVWHCEMQRIENDYYLVMGALISLLKGKQTADEKASEKSVHENPLELPNFL